MPDFCGFCVFKIFLKFIFEKMLDFLKLRNHNNRAFKLALCNLKKSQPLNFRESIATLLIKAAHQNDF